MCGLSKSHDVINSKKVKHLFVLSIILLFPSPGSTQTPGNEILNDTTKIERITVYRAAAFTSVYYAGSIYVFNHTWYDNLQIFYNELRYGDRFGRLATEQVFIQVVNLLTTFNSESPEQRYIRFAMNHKHSMQRIPQYHIASHIGVTPQALCRIKKKILIGAL